MKPRRVKMSREEFERLPFRLAWKQELINGYLIETPREVFVHATIPVAPRPLPSPVVLRPTRESDEKELLPCFLAAFEHAFEYGEYTKKRFEESARLSLSHFFHGPFHLALPASRVAVGPPGTSEADKPIGAALVLAQDEGWALLDMIFFSPAWHRHGLATALAACMLTALHELGQYQTLVSRYHLGNEASRDWHHRFGFRDEPDLRLARLYHRAATHELHRQRALGTLTPQLQSELEQQGEHWQREVDRLEHLFQQGHRAEADPWYKWRKKRSSD